MGYQAVLRKKGAQVLKSEGKITWKTRVACLLLAWCLAMPPTGVAAAGTEAATETGEYRDMYASFTEEDYETRDFDELMEEFAATLQSRTGILALGYINTVTGEEHFYNADEYIFGASTYKAPLNMYMAEQVAEEKASFDDQVGYIPYRTAQERSLVYSDNRISQRMVQDLGGLRAFRKDVAAYMGEEADDAEYAGHGMDWTARQLTRCMCLLAREPERFPGVVECLKEAAAEEFLEWAPVPYEVAQKYGSVISRKGAYMHVTGIIWTDEPIAVTVMTVNTGETKRIMGGFCEMCCHYAEYTATGSSRLPDR